MRILLLGASGGCGRWFGRLAAARGHDVTAVVRPETEYEAPPRVRVIRGQAVDPELLGPLVPDADRIVSCLGIRRVGKSPWARILSPPDLVHRATAALVESIQRQPSGARPRLVWISAGGVGNSRAATSAPVRRMIGLGHVATAYRDLAAAEELARSSGIEHLAVRHRAPGRPTRHLDPRGPHGAGGADRPLRTPVDGA